MPRILPGVEIRVVKEIVPQQLRPSGIVGMIGTAEKGPVLVPTPVSSFREFMDIFGSDTRFSLTKEAKQAFQNGVFQVVAVRVEGKGGKAASIDIPNPDGKPIVRLEARMVGEAGNNIRISVREGTREGTYLLEIYNGKSFEGFDNLSLDLKDERYLVNYVNRHSKLLVAREVGKKVEKRALAVPFESSLKGGTQPQVSLSDYERALEALELEPDVDAVMVCDNFDPKVHALVEAHCQNMSKNAMPRIGIGTVAPGEDVKSIVKRTEVLASDRFVLVAPYGVAGAVAGLISKLPYYESPTFKALSGVSELERRYTPSEQSELVKSGILVVDARRGRGIIVVKGITTSGEQISVIRVADRAVRGVKNVAENFIGTLNSPGGRIALREKITEFLISMERDGAIVPSVDGTKPPFMVDVYCSELDFAQGIVRVDVAVRPVRAMDYIYATITVEA